MAKRKQTALEDLISIAANMRWSVGVLLAMASYLILHLIAGMPISMPNGGQSFPVAIIGLPVKFIAAFAQFIIPLAFLIGAVISAIRQIKGDAVASRRKGSFDEYLEHSRNHGGTDTAGGLQTDKPGGDIYKLWKSAPSDGRLAANVGATRWNPELLALLEWKRFEEVCAGLFERLGFETKMFASGADGGVDIRLYQPPSNLPVAIVQCKAWTKRVGVNVIRELRGVMAAEGVAEGIFATTSTYSDDAIAFASANHIDLMDGKRVLDTILKLPEEQQASLLRLATAGDYTTPTCASCGVKLVLRTPARGKPFWGCVNYPRCKMIINIAGA